MVFHDIHQSGFHGVTHPQRRRCDRLVAEQCSVAGLTERHGLKFLVPGWGEYGNETKLVWAERKWRLIESDTIVIPTVTWKRGNSTKHTVEIPWVFLERKTAFGGPYTLLRLDFHFPAHLFDKNQRTANATAFEQQGEQILALQRHLHPDETTEAGDGNRDFRLSKNVHTMEHGLAGTHMNVLVPPAKTIRGVLGRRIDVFAGHGDLEMLPWLDGYDHRGIKRTSRTGGH